MRGPGRGDRAGGRAAAGSASCSPADTVALTPPGCGAGCRGSGSSRAAGRPGRAARPGPACPAPLGAAWPVARGPGQRREPSSRPGGDAAGRAPGIVDRIGPVVPGLPKAGTLCRPPECGQGRTLPGLGAGNQLWVPRASPPPLWATPGQGAAREGARVVGAIRLRQRPLGLHLRFVRAERPPPPPTPASMAVIRSSPGVGGRRPGFVSAGTVGILGSVTVCRDCEALRETLKCPAFHKAAALKEMKGALLHLQAKCFRGKDHPCHFPVPQEKQRYRFGACIVPEENVNLRHTCLIKVSKRTWRQHGLVN
ncbi:uncharacterized protein LOC142084545 [Calonectris borealis]|uniref:uncharacterized protein LOC142084545 n=1 Tax=Calonectris borealis TaxID=1323832 RepID=UPI003F4B36BB